MPFYCSLHSQVIIELVDSGGFPPPDVTLANFETVGGIESLVSVDAFRRIDAIFLGWMSARIESAFRRMAAARVAAGEQQESPVDEQKLSEAIDLFQRARQITGLAPCSLEEIPRGYDKPKVFGPADGRPTFFHVGSEGRGESGAGEASKLVELTRRARAMAGMGDGGRSWQAELDRWF